MRIIKRLGPRYGRSNNNVHTTARHMESLWLVHSFSAALVSRLEQHSIGRVVIFFCCCSSTHCFQESHSSVLTMYWFVASGSVNIGGFLSIFLRFSTTPFLAFVREGSDVGWSLVFLFSEAATLKQLGAKRRKTLQMPKTGLSSV